MSDLNYFVIPFDEVPDHPSYTVWYATWTQERPMLEPGMNRPMVVGATPGDTLPHGATVLGRNRKDPVPPPPPPPPKALGVVEYQQAFEQWVTAGRDEDE